MSKCIVFLIALCYAAQDEIIPIKSMTQFPHHVTIRATEKNHEHYCFGSILNPFWILTTSGCVHNGLNFELIFNRTNLDDTQSNSFSINVDKSAVYEDPRNIAGLFKLPSPLRFSEHIQPISLLNNDNLDLMGRTLTFSGKANFTQNIVQAQTEVLIKISPLHPQVFEIPCMNIEGAGVLIDWPEDTTLIGIFAQFGSNCEGYPGTSFFYKITRLTPWITSLVNNGNV